MKTFKEFVNESKNMDDFGLPDEDIKIIKKFIKDLDKSMSPAAASSYNKKLKDMQLKYGLTRKEINMIYSKE